MFIVLTGERNLKPTFKRYDGLAFTKKESLYIFKTMEIFQKCTLYDIYARVRLEIQSAFVKFSCDF